MNLLCEGCALIRNMFPFLLLKVFYNEVQVNQVDVTSTTGSFGILPGHVPVINVLQPGLVSVYENDKVTKFFGMSLPGPRNVFFSVKSDF